MGHYYLTVSGPPCIPDECLEGFRICMGRKVLEGFRICMGRRFWRDYHSFSQIPLLLPDEPVS